MPIKQTCGALLLFGVLAAEPAAATVISFDNVGDGTAIDLAYTGLGVTFNNPVGGNIYARSSSIAASSPNVVSVFQTGFFGAFDARDGAVEAVFSSGQRQVSIDSAIVRLPEGLGTPANFPKLEVYSTLGTLIAVVNWNFALIPQPPAGGITGYQTLSFTSGSDDIGRVRFFSGQPGGSPSNFGVFDNLSFNAGAAPIPEPMGLVIVGIGIAAVALVGRRRAA